MNSKKQENLNSAKLSKEKQNKMKKELRIIVGKRTKPSNVQKEDKPRPESKENQDNEFKEGSPATIDAYDYMRDTIHTVTEEEQIEATSFPKIDLNFDSKDSEIKEKTMPNIDNSSTL